MTGVTHDLAAGNAVIADNLDTNFADVVSLATSVGNAQLAGNITYDKLTDRYGLMVVSQEILPFSSGADWSTGVGFTVPTSATRVKVFAPTIKPGWEAALCAIKVYIEEADVAGTNSADIDFRRNASTVLGGGTLSLSGSNDQHTYLLAANDPIANPLTSLQDGDYIETRLWDGGTAAVRPRGITVEFVLKHVLVP